MIRFLLFLFTATMCTPSLAQRYPPSGSGGCAIYANQAALPLSAVDGTCAVTTDADTIWVYHLSGTAWIAVAAGVNTGDVTLAAVGSSPNTSGASLSGQVLTLQPADGTRPGLLSASAQTVGGAKTFSSAPILSSLSASLPLQLDGSKVVVSSAIDLSGSQATGTLAAARFPALTGDITTTAGALGTTLASVNSNIGSFGSSTAIPSFTVGAKGLITAASSSAVIAPAGTLSGSTLASGVTASSLTSLGAQAAALNMNSHLINSVTDPASAQDAATKNYVDTQLLQLNPAQAVYAASTASITGTYTNAVGGVCIGDLFTVTATGALSMDGTSPPIGSRVLLKNQTNSFQDGVWTVTVVGTTGVSPVLTRALDFDTSADLNAGSIVPIINGTVNAGSSYYQTATVTTCSSDSQTWTQFQAASSAYLLKANNLSDVSTKATAFDNLSPMSALGDVIYGGTSGTGTRLAGNTTSTKKYLSQTGTGSVSAAPAWAQPACGDLSNAAASCSTDTTVATNITTGTLGSTVQGNITSVGTITSGTWSGTTVAVNKGGTGQTSYTDGQLLIGNTSGNTLSKATLTAGSNITITNGNGTITVAAASATAAYNYTSQTTTYSAVINDWVVASGASFTITLPTAASQSGKAIVIQHAGTSNTQVYTLNTTSSQTIGGIASGSYALYTNGEALTLLSDGSNWQIASHRTETAWTSYTPTFTGFGTVNTQTFWWKRSGTDVLVRGEFTAGTNTATEARVTLPASVTSDSTYTTLQTAGNWGTDTTLTGGFYTAVQPSKTYFVFTEAVSANSLFAMNANAIINNAAKVALNVRAAVSGWQP
jgi:hypothetical protein